MGFLPTSLIQGNPPLYEEDSLWEALSVVSQKWIPFPTALSPKAACWRAHHIFVPRRATLHAYPPSPWKRNRFHRFRCPTCPGRRLGGFLKAPQDVVAVFGLSIKPPNTGVFPMLRNLEMGIGERKGGQKDASPITDPRILRIHARVREV